MIILGYVGNHKHDDLGVRLGWLIIRLVQTGQFKRITHTESILFGTNYRDCSIGSASLRDGGVRVKPHVSLTKGNWVAYDIPEFKAEMAAQWFATYDSCRYNVVGAIAARFSWLLWLGRAFKGFFCSQSCLAPYVSNAEEFMPAEAFDLLVSKFGAVPVTDLFFKD